MNRNRVGDRGRCLQLDMLFARLATKEVDEKTDLDDDTILKNLSEQCVRSLNGAFFTLCYFKHSSLQAAA